MPVAPLDPNLIPPAPSINPGFEVAPRLESMYQPETQVVNEGQTPPPLNPAQAGLVETLPLNPRETADPSKYGLTVPGGAPQIGVAWDESMRPGIPSTFGKIEGGGGGFGKRQPSPLTEKVENILNDFSTGKINRAEVHKQLKGEGFSVNLRKQKEWEITGPDGRIHNIPHFAGRPLQSEVSEESLREYHDWLANDDKPNYDPSSIRDNYTLAAAMAPNGIKWESWRRSENIEDRRAWGQELHDAIVTRGPSFAEALWSGAQITLNDIKALVGQGTTVEDIGRLNQEFWRDVPATPYRPKE